MINQIVFESMAQYDRVQSGPLLVTGVEHASMFSDTMKWKLGKASNFVVKEIVPARSQKARLVAMAACRS